MDLTGRSRRSSTLLFKKFKKRLENNTIKENWKKEIITQPLHRGLLIFSHIHDCSIKPFQGFQSGDLHFQWQQGFVCGTICIFQYSGGAALMVASALKEPYVNNPRCQPRMDSKKAICYLYSSSPGYWGHIAETLVFSKTIF